VRGGGDLFAKLRRSSTSLTAPPGCAIASIRTAHLYRLRRRLAELDDASGRAGRSNRVPSSARTRMTSASGTRRPFRSAGAVSPLQFGLGLICARRGPAATADRAQPNDHNRILNLPGYAHGLASAGIACRGTPQDHAAQVGGDADRNRCLTAPLSWAPAMLWLSTTARSPGDVPSIGRSKFSADPKPR
jgi:hypothetical protein